VLHECIRTTLKQIEKRRQGAGRKKTAETPPPGSTYVPAPVRKEVWERDGGQCTFVSESGRRCSSRHQLEFHHLLAVAYGGLSTAANVCLRCRGHNRYAAEQDFGQEHVAGKIASRRERGRAVAEVALRTVRQPSIDESCPS
jgi:5-methylcytosine-specific restriction endonuclease McrA